MKGRAHKFGDNVDTDSILPGRYLKLTGREAASHVMEGLAPGFAQRVQPGDIIVAGSNFGCGSGRENATEAVKYAGIGAVIALSFSRLFFRSAINIGLPVLECPDAGSIEDGDL
ncbi:MAG: 3-isopropylmalate dehydratase small subunit, partial [Dehalococcoidia bacterium]|nr:3-isopropylmalate dehydratase small subunit [Dehalococcoidia bacterium]